MGTRPFLCFGGAGIKLELFHDVNRRNDGARCGVARR
jgi:hypothetical protein